MPSDRFRALFTLSHGQTYVVSLAFQCQLSLAQGSERTLRWRKLSDISGIDPDTRLDRTARSGTASSFSAGSIT